MDDPTSRKQIDELAELYLTGVVDGSNADDTPADQDSPIDGPEPIRLPPKLDEPGHPGGNPPGAGAFANDLNDAAGKEPDDRHPVLRLTESEQEDPTLVETDTQTDPAQETGPAVEVLDADDNEPAPQAVVEAVVLGNLPGMSGPWLTQYAQLIAQSEGPVALLHVGESAIDLELIEPRAEAEPSPAGSIAAVRIPPMRGNKTGLVGLLDALTRSESAPTRTILVRLEPGDDAVTLSRFAALEDWTLLCGSDDASIAGATQQLRQIVRADPRLADRGIGLMVMGSDEASAHAAASRVSLDMQGDLANQVEFIGHLKRMQPVQVREIGSFPDPVGVWPQLVAWFDTLEPPSPEMADTGQAIKEQEPERPAVIESIVPPPDVQPAQQTAPTAQRLSPEAAGIGTPASRPSPRPGMQPTPPIAPPTQRTASARGGATQQAAATRQPGHTPAPATASEPTRPAPQPRVLTPRTELDLVALLAGGPAAIDQPAVLDARLPDQPGTQLAVDAHGVVHILKQGTDPMNDTVMQLIAAGQWVRDHLELLALTQRDRDFIDTDPVLHLFTDRADLATQLVGKLAGRVKLHLLQQVQIGRESGWFCTPLG